MIMAIINGDQWSLNITICFIDDIIITICGDVIIVIMFI